MVLVLLVLLHSVGRLLIDNVECRMQLISVDFSHILNNLVNKAKVHKILLVDLDDAVDQRGHIGSEQP